MADTFLEKISKLKDKLKKLKNKLREIPEYRDLTCTYEKLQLNPPTWLYRPRFKPQDKLISQELKLEFIQLIDDLNLYLQKYSPDNFTNITNIIDLSGNNKKSIIFLLEKDVYNTDEVYGEYLVIKYENYYEINYYRRNVKRIQLPNQDISIDLEEFIMNDIITQIQNQFDIMWLILENEIRRCESNFKSLEIKNYEEKINLIKKLLKTKECEFLDFKIAMYMIFPKNKTSGLEQRKEFLKDVLGLVNNKRTENNSGRAYILIGVGELNEKYDGTHKNVNFTDFATLVQLINEYVTPKINIEIDEYYISGDNINIQIISNKKKGYNRNLLFKLLYEIGVVYEIKKKIGNTNMDVEYYHEGTSFTRDGSLTRRLRQEDRKRIMKNADQHSPIIEKNKIKRYFKELFSFLNQLFSEEEIGINSIRFIVKYLDENHGDFNNYFKFNKEMTTPGSVQNFYFLRGKYRIHFMYNKKPTIYLNDKNMKDKADMGIVPQKARLLFENMCKEIKEHIKMEFGLKLE